MVMMHSALGLLTLLALAMAKSPAAEVRDIRSAFLSDAVEAPSEYRRELQKAARTAESDYEKASASAARAGDVAAATNATRQILWLDTDTSDQRLR